MSMIVQGSTGRRSVDSRKDEVYNLDKGNLHESKT